MRRADEVLEESQIEHLARQRELVLGYRQAAWVALAFARRYRIEEGVAGGEREKACIAQAQVWRRAVRDLRAGHPVETLPRSPGLARAEPRASASGARAKRA
ncbi:MAG: hypothetical protein JST00_14505 [Deltaproteobacteria bacterium]|nr:hypothetical protein [Deltaproteobacteria bacterium]